MVKTLHLLDTISARLCGDGRRVDVERPPAAAAIADPATATIQALAAPLDYPPLADSIVSGDRVAIVVDVAVPCAAAIVRGAVMSLASAGVDSEAISIVVASRELADLFREEFSNDNHDAKVVLHDPDDEANLCFIGLTRGKQPLVVNRAIHEADVVLPIGVPRPGRGAFDSLFPQMSSAAVINQHRTPASMQSAADRKLLRQETRKAGWMIGVALSIQVVPGPGDSVVHIQAGEPISVTRRGAALYRDEWSRHSTRQAGLVIASVRGGPLAQTWQNVAQALATANKLVTDDGAIAICTNLDQPLGESLGRLVGTPDLARTRRKLFHEHADDSWAAWQLARSLSRGPVYLLSQMEAEAVEEFGLAPIANIDELARLAGRQESFIVLEDAQHVLADVEGEDADA